MDLIEQDKLFPKINRDEPWELPPWVPGFSPEEQALVVNDLSVQELLYHGFKFDADMGWVRPPKNGRI